MHVNALTVAIVVILFISSDAFVAPSTPLLSNNLANPGTSLMAAAQTEGNADPNEIIARRIVVSGDVQGGYYRSCVINEAGRFRKLIGTMTPPEDSDSAEIYVEGKRNMVEGFVRWCKRGNVGLSQNVTVKEVAEEVPTGLYDGFYAKTGR